MPKAGKPLRLPREHGFWVMLTAVLLAALIRARFGLTALIATVVVLGVSVLGAAALSRRIRGSGNAQIGSALALAWLGAPVELAAGGTLSGAAAVAVAWMGVFVSSATCVRAAFSRAKGDLARCRMLVAVSVFVPAALGVAFYLSAERDAALASLVAAVGALILGAWAPGVKQLKRVGLSLALVAFLAMLALAL